MKYKRVNIKELSEILPKDELINLYKDHPMSYICSKYNLTKYEFGHLLNYYNIEPHTKSQVQQMVHAEDPMRYTGGTHMYNNGIEQGRFKPGEEPEGWVQGGLDYTDEQTEIMLAKRGNRSPMQTEIGKENFKKSMLDKYGVDNPMKLRDVFLKVNKGKFSKKEDRYYNYLVSIYGADDVVRNYKCERYPFFCDFYIKSKDLFIECNFHWTHGPKPFDVNDFECQHILDKWKEEAEEKDSKYIRQAIHIWTELDPLKRETARKNNLNYEEIFDWNG